VARRAFAIVPAAGESRRMGEPKLLLPIGGQPLIAHTLAAWNASRVERIIVVVRPDDDSLAHLVQAAGAIVCQPPDAPPDMKASLCFGLAHVAEKYQPTDEDFWLVAPADMPGLSPRVIDALLAAAEKDRILIPTLGGRRGHPVLLPWPLAAEVPWLGPDEGLRDLFSRHDPLLVACDAAEPDREAPFADLDTPADLARFRGQVRSGP
jgi:molybdenum cofactor cytidylyltransferase